ncbi:MAG TPA: FAD-binding protein [Planctomycetota bacterium]|nr:FAD-binding protein [Planctomycetota bacterium]
MNCSTTWPCAALPAADLSGRTTMKVGGRAPWLLEPATPDEFREVWLLLRERGLAARVLGGGANLLIADGELDFVVLSTTRMGRIFRPGAGANGGEALSDSGEQRAEQLARVAPAPRDEDPRLVAWAGASLPGLLRTARELGWSGLEGLVGVPGSAGGAAAMNAGGHWGDFWDVVEAVRVITPEGELVDIPRAQANPGYRDGGLGENIALGVVLALEVSERAAVATAMDSCLREKNAVQPVTEASSGCIFKNPDPELSGGRGAGQLIDECGGKELRRGAALVSPRHANFIINSGGASATDVLTLIEDTRDLVAQQTGLRLETEVRIWP